MQSVLIVIHLMIVVALVVTVLLQRSEGGALGVGGGGGFMTGRGQANVLTRATAILAALFFATSLGLTVLARMKSGPFVDPAAYRAGKTRRGAGSAGSGPGRRRKSPRPAEEDRGPAPGAALAGLTRNAGALDSQPAGGQRPRGVAAPP